MATTTMITENVVAAQKDKVVELAAWKNQETSKKQTWPASKPKAQMSWWARTLGRSPSIWETVIACGSMFVVMLVMCFYKYAMSIWEVLGWWAVGSALYTLSEYWFHRVILHHWLRGPHGNHHNNPRLLRIIVTPMIPVTVYDFVVVLAVMLVCGKKIAYGINCGIATGQIIMDVTHVLFHSDYRPWWLEAGRSYHNYHHFIAHEEAHGLTTSFWDMCFGTLPERWILYEKYPWLRFVQFPFPLLSFMIAGFLVQREKTAQEAEERRKKGEKGMGSKGRKGESEGQTSDLVRESRKRKRDEQRSVLRLERNDSKREAFQYSVVPLMIILWEIIGQ